MAPHVPTPQIPELMDPKILFCSVEREGGSETVDVAHWSEGVRMLK